jgi:hypothetical protein
MTRLDGGLAVASPLTVDNQLILPVARNPYRAGAFRTAVYNSVATTFTRFPFDTIQYDPFSRFDVTTNVGRYTCPVPGYYSVRGSLSFGNVTRGIVSVYVNGAEVRRGNDLTLNGFGGMVSAEPHCNAGDFLEVWYFATTGAQAFTVAGGLCWIDITYTGP